MDVRVEIGDARTVAEVASRILTSAWDPPCLRYSPTYLAWQLGFPGAVQHRSAVAFVGDDAVGCIGVTPRRLLSDGVAITVYVLSFVAVNAAARGRGLGVRLYATLLEAIPPDIPVVAFTRPKSTGERVLLRACADAGYRHRPLRACRGIAYVQRHGGGCGDGLTVAAQTESYAEFVSAAESADDYTTMWNYPTLEQWRHYQADSRERFTIVIRGSEGRVVGSAMGVVAEFVSARGIERVPMFESVCVSRSMPAALRAAFRFAGERCGVGSTIVASNLSYLSSATIAEAGARAGPWVFNAHAFNKGAAVRLEGMDALNVEVI